MKTEVVSKPWGCEILWAKTEKYAGKILFVKAGHRLSLQMHEAKQETIYLQKGKANILIGEFIDGQLMDDRVIELSPNESVDILPGTIHRITAIEDSTFLEVSTPELDDVIRIEDDYRR